MYKNLWPSLREFWLWAVNQHADKMYIVFGNQRYTYRQVHQRAIKVAGVFRHIYDIKKGAYSRLISFARSSHPQFTLLFLRLGDRVGICSRNCPDYLVSFWACRAYLVVLLSRHLTLIPLDLIGAVSVLTNA